MPYGTSLDDMAPVLFVCLHHARRSQMSQALFEQAADGRHTARELTEQADAVTMGCGDSCPQHLWQTPPRLGAPRPGGRPIDEVRTRRDEIAKRVRQLLADL